VGFVELNFRHALQGGNIAKCITWPGGYQLYVLLLVLFMPAFVADYSFNLAMWGLFFPGAIILIVLLKSKYSLYKCSACKSMYAGPRLASYQNDDTTYI
jgi:hypothetical protein